MREEGAETREAAEPAARAVGAMRFVVRVDPEWSITVACPGHDDSWAEALKDAKLGGPRAMAKVADGHGGLLPGGTMRGPADLVQPDGEAAARNVDEANAEAVYRAYSAITARVDPPIAAFGRYLFDALLGPELWAAMSQFAEAGGADSLELAIMLPKHDGNLHRLPWEMLRGPTDFVAAGIWNGPVRKLGVAITRLVDGHDAARLPEGPTTPKVLFVIGTGLADEQIRPGAELFGLLRQLRRDRAVRRMVLERASIGTLEAAMASFAPDVVHFICHGGINNETGEPYLTLETDQGNEEPNRTAGQLVHAVGSAGRLPTIVVLSACFTSSQSGREEFVPAGAEAVAPMATTFVDAGVPIVVGMSGRVSDLTCRLFTRQFGASIVAGEPIVRATATARMATFVQGTDNVRTPDWALPTVFLASGIGPDATPFPVRTEDDGWKNLDAWIARYELIDTPIFCGRGEHIRQFRTLVEPTGDGPPKGALAILVQEAGLGGSRLLREMAITALQAGHIPVRVATTKGQQPTTLEEIVRALANAIDDNPIAGYSEGKLQLDLLAKAADGEDVTGLADGVARALDRSGQITPAMVRMSAQLDFADLLRRASNRYPQYKAPTARVVVFLDDVHLYGPDMVTKLTDDSGAMIGPFGFGTEDRPAPVVFAFKHDQATDALIGSASEPRIKTSWIDLTTLGPFAEGEDMLACTNVLLHPYAPALYTKDDLSKKAWALVDLSRDEYLATANSFRRHHERKPGWIAGPQLYLAAGTALDFGRLVEADDEARLKRITDSAVAR